MNKTACQAALILLFSNITPHAQTINPTIIVYSYDVAGCTTSRKDPNSMADFLSLRKENTDTINVKVYPLIVDTQITISITNHNDISDTKAYIFSIEGEKVSQHNITAPLTSINLSQLKHGIYVLNVTTDNKTGSFKLVKL